jgi:hypothetical protein
MRAATFLLMIACLPLRLSADERLPLLHADDFEAGVERWQTSDPDPVAKPTWEVVELENAGGQLTKAFRTTGKSSYKPPFRSPPNFALLKGISVGDFELTAKVQSTNVGAGPHRDMCILWGYQDPAHYYYVHFGAESDPNACQIFIVNNAARTPITTKKAKGTPWTTGWHEVRVVRRVDDGTIKVYFDDMDEPLMAAQDDAFKWGQVGLGTFDDHGNWDDFELRGVEAKRADVEANRATK